MKPGRLARSSVLDRLRDVAATARAFLRAQPQNGAPTASAARATAAPARAVQTARMTSLSLQRPRPFSSSAPRGQDARDLLFYDAAINHPEFGVTPASILGAFRTAEAGDPTQQSDLFDGLVEGDCHLRSLFEKREQAVAGKPRVIQAGDASSEAQLAAEVLRIAHEGLPLVDVFEHLLKYNRHGYSACEIDWGIRRIGGRDWIVPTWYAPVPVRRFRINAGALGLLNGGGLDELRLITDYRRALGDPLRTGKWFLLRRSGTMSSRCGP